MADTGLILSDICEGIKNTIDTVAINDTNINVSIGAPALAHSNKNNHQVNLFFYRFEPFGFDADITSKDELLLKTFCLITAFGVAESTHEKSGLVELKLLSKIIQLFHDTPVLLLPSDKAKQAHVQFIFRPLQDEQINQIWSTQNSTIYHPSVLYEIAMVPISPKESPSQPARVAQVGVEAVYGVENQKNTPISQARYRAPSINSPIKVRTEFQDWCPVICLVYDNECTTSLSLEIKNQNFKINDLKFWLAGDKEDSNSTYTLVGSVLKREQLDKKETSWGEDAAIANMIAVPLVPHGDVIDPHVIQGNISSLPDLDISKISYQPDSNDHWQLQLFVERHYKTMNGEAKIARSNPVLITLWERQDV